MQFIYETFIPFLIALIFFFGVVFAYYAMRRSRSERILNERLRSVTSAAEVVSDQDSGLFKVKGKNADARIKEVFTHSRNPVVAKLVEIYLIVGVIVPAIIFMIVTPVALYVLSSYMFLPFWTAFLLSAFASLFVLLTLINFLLLKRHAIFMQSFPSALDIVSRGLRAGVSIERTFTTIQNEIDGPVGDEFRFLVEQINIGVPFEDALRKSIDRVNIPDYSFFAIALIIQRRTGGALSELVSGIAELLRKRENLRQKVKALSSEAKATGLIVGSMPILTFLIISVANPTYFDAFRYDPMGHKLFMLIIGLMIAGVVTVRKMIKFEV